MSSNAVKRIVVAVAIATQLAACATRGAGPVWGANATLFPKKSDLLSAGGRAFFDPDTWAPALGAAIISAGGWDKPITEWAFEQKPLFGSKDSALTASDTFQDIAGVGMLASALATSGTDNFRENAWSKIKGLAVESTAVTITGDITTGLKSLIGRERPDGGDHGSFPSAHSSRAFVYSTLGRRNLQSIDGPPFLKKSAEVGFYAVAGLTAWARVEANVHYPVDVLAGAALGNLIGVFIHDAFLDPESASNTYLSLEPYRGGMALRMQFVY